MRYKTSMEQRGQPDRYAQSLAQFLGAFSLLVGIGEFIFAGALTRGLGLEGCNWIIPLCGAREIITGVLIFSSKDPTPWIWLRVIGEVLDTGAVIFGYSRHLAANSNFIITFFALAGAFVIDIYCAMRLSSGSKQPLPAAHVAQGGITGA